MITAFCTFLLLILGALVTSNDAGLSVPDWPTSFHHWPITYGYFKVALVGGVRYEHTHRILAQLVGLLTIILAVWTQRVDRRAWVRKLGWTALGTVIAQGVLGGITVLFYLPPAVSTAHATLAQTFFCIVVAMALFTGRTWTEVEPRKHLAEQRPALPKLATAAAMSVYVQLILGAAFRHHGIKLLPHLISAAVVTFLILWTVVRTLTEYGKVEQLRRLALSLLSLLMVQLVLGFASWLTRVEWGRDAPQPEMPMVLSTVSHVAVGALLLATTVVLAIQSWRHIAIPTAERVAARDAKAVTA
ncbi:MAG TPA: COX15/CtaA family protein [Terriglobales bacterium]|nr:COX15/CtaA family protein [Terriglobales bacterium]